MKGLLKKILTGAVVGASVVTFASCGDKGVKYEAYTLDQFRGYALADLDDVLASCGDLKDYPTVEAAVKAKYDAGVASINAAADKAAVTAAFDAAKAGIASAIPYANGGYSYAGLSNAEKTEILGILEAFAVRNGLTGISLFENGGYGIYSDRIKFGTETYIPGYGFGNLAEGDIIKDMENESNVAWKKYYHSANSNDPGTANYLNDQGSEVSTFYGYFSASYFTTFMNETKDGYDWVPELASAKPTAINADSKGLATKWKFPVKTGSHDGLKYTTLSTKADRAVFNNRDVAIEDYETAFKFLLTQSNHLFRGSEMAGNEQEVGGIVGTKAFYDATKEGFDAAAWDKVGIKAYEDENGQGWLEYEFTSPLSQFYSMYYISSSLYQPVPQDFIDAVGVTGTGDAAVTNYCGYNSDKSYTPVDNSLALGAYVLEAWNTDQEVVYKKNPNYVFAATKYKVPGVHINILPAALEDRNAVFKEYLAGNLDSAGVPQDYLDEYKNNPQVKKTTGDSNFKLNVNACDYDTWVKLFGKDGIVTDTPESGYWDVEPALGNSHFVKALSLSINRNEFAEKRGSIASVDYLSSNYMSDPENGISYATTDAHAGAVAGLLEGTENGYNQQLARDYFKLALEELVNAGLYEEGTKDNPTVIDLEIAWQVAAHEESYHNEIAKYFTDAFNHDSVHGGKFKLEVNFWVGNVWSDVYYSKMMLGQFDLGFGSISGDPLNPLSFISVLSSDLNMSGGFTLNWGVDTNNPDSDLLVYNGMRWSFDALYNAANTSAVVENGKNAALFAGAEMEFDEATKTAVVTVAFNAKDGASAVVDDLIIFAGDSSETYSEYSLFKDPSRVVKSEVDGKVVYTVTLTDDEIAWVKPFDNCGIDVYIVTTVAGNVSASTFAQSVYFEFE